MPEVGKVGEVASILEAAWKSAAAYTVEQQPNMQPADTITPGCIELYELLDDLEVDAPLDVRTAAVKAVLGRI